MFFLERLIAFHLSNNKRGGNNQKENIKGTNCTPGFFLRAGNFRVFRGFSKNRENILPRKITDAKNYLHEKGQSKITLRKRVLKGFFLSLMCLFVFRAMVKSYV